MNRIFSVSIASLLACSFIFAQPHPRYAPHSRRAGESGERGRVRAPQGDSEKCFVTFAFHGLIVFHERGGHFEVGIVSGAPDHVFAIIRDGGERVCLGENIKLKNWRLEVRSGKRVASRDGVGTEVKGEFHRKGTRGSNNSERDFRWLVNFDDELHPTKPPKMFTGMFQPVLTITTGKLFTLCKTVSMDISKGRGGPKEFGSVAEIVGLEIELHKDETLVLRSVGKGGGEVLPIPYEKGGRLGYYVANLPAHHLKTALNAFKNKSGEPHVGSTAGTTTDGFGPTATHLQNYYLLFPVPPSERREIRLSPSRLSPSTTQPSPCAANDNKKFTDQFADLVGKIRLTPDPYRCLEMSVGKSRRPLR